MPATNKLLTLAFFPLYPLEIGSKAVKGSTVTGCFEHKCTFLPKMKLTLVISSIYQSVIGLFALLS